MYCVVDETVAVACSSGKQTVRWTTERQPNKLLRSRFRMQPSRCVPYFDNRTKPRGELRVEEEEEEGRKGKKNEGFMAESAEIFSVSVCECEYKYKRFHMQAPKKPFQFPPSNTRRLVKQTGPLGSGSTKSLLKNGLVWCELFPPKDLHTLICCGQIPGKMQHA